MHLRFTPLSPLVARDSRPFGEGQGNRIRSLDWLPQSVVAGAVRTAVWKQNDALTPEQLKTIVVGGAFPLVRDVLHFPRPFDLVTRKEGETLEAFPIRPQEREGLGVRMPCNLAPAFPVGLPDEDFKPEKNEGFWSAALMAEWLGMRDEAAARSFVPHPEAALPFPQKAERTHVTIDFASGAAEDSKLFSTVGLDFVHDFRRKKQEAQDLAQMRIAARVDFAGFDLLPDRFLVPLGGERRLAEVDVREDDSLWAVPPALSEGLKGTKQLRMVLATPAVFAKGWLPGWLSASEGSEGRPCGTIPGTSVRVRLVSAVVGRWKPLSGWSYEKGKHGPKALRRMVPAGSVYFFEVEDGAFSLDDKTWLSSVCDEPQDRRDGFGLALWGRY